MNIRTIIKMSYTVMITTFITQNAFSDDLDKLFGNIFDEVLINQLRLSPDFHSVHFIEAANQANRDLTPALNSLIANEVSSFPLSTTSPGVTFDFFNRRTHQNHR